jgi:23S rRNA methylase
MRRAVRALPDEAVDPPPARVVLSDPEARDAVLAHDRSVVRFADDPPAGTDAETVDRRGEEALARLRTAVRRAASDSTAAAADASRAASSPSGGTRVVATGVERTQPPDRRPFDGRPPPGWYERGGRVVRVTGRDEYYNRAKQEGYRSRSAYKLRQIDETADVLPRGGVAVDVGAAPGGWLQVAAERVGPRGRVVGVDRQRIEDVEKTDDRAHVETVRGDVTDETTRDRLLDAVGDGADAVVSDVAPNMTGEYTVDHARSVHLAGVALDVAVACLRPGGDFVAKVFDGPDLDRLRDDVDAEFEYVRDVRPDASRDSSSELYLVGKGRMAAPVAEDEVRTFDVVDTGTEGDGIARVDGYAVFVDAAAGETVRARVTDVKPNYAFTERVDEGEE